MTIFLASLAFGVQAADWQVLTGRVVGVSDGDTITLLVERQTTKIRLAGIDAPEKSQPFGHRSKQLLSSLVFGKTVTVEYRKRDRYGRIVGKVLLPGGRDANLEMLKGGMAWFYVAYANELRPEDRALYAEAERQKEDSRQGLWGDLNPVPPWDFRHSRESK